HRRTRLEPGRLVAHLSAGCRGGLRGGGARRRRTVHQPERWGLGMRAARLALAVVAVLLANVSAAQAVGLTVSNDRAAIATKLGHKFVFHSTIRNNGAAPARGLVAHLN